MTIPENKHQKHPKLIRPDLGEFARKEWGFLGTSCGKIQEVAKKIAAPFSTSFNIAYVDAEHPKENGIAIDGFKEDPFLMTYTDKINYHQLEFESSFDRFQRRRWFNEVDIAFINGNHFKAARQIVFIDAAKEDSLKRKVDRLSQVDLFILCGNQSAPFQFLEEALPHFNEIPVLKEEDHEAIINFFQNQLNSSVPPIYGLVLAGGKSIRMGQDKGAIKYHNKPHRIYTAELLDSFCDRVFISGRKEQAQNIEKAFPFLEDRMIGLGPYGGILSAFITNPNVAWLVLACDLPFVNSATIKQLIEGRNPSKTATAFYNEETNFPEPLITIWEPKAYLPCLSYLSQGYSCPRKVLINESIELLHPKDKGDLKNANDKKALEEAMKKIQEQ